MTVIAKAITTAVRCWPWHRALAQVAAHAQAQGAHLARTVVLVPYAS